MVFAVQGCSGPVWQFPGGAMEGPEQALSMDMLDNAGGVIQLETNPADPYSVNIGYVVVNGNMYIDPTESRTWYQNIKADARVRIRFDGEKVIHPAKAVEEQDPVILARFENDRHVLRVVPRDS